MFSCNLGSYAASNHPKQPHQCFHFLPCKYSTVLCIAKLSSSFSWHWTRGEKEKQTNIQIKKPNKTERRNKEQKNVNMRAKKEMVVCLKSSKIPLSNNFLLRKQLLVNKYQFFLCKIIPLYGKLYAIKCLRSVCTNMSVLIAAKRDAEISLVWILTKYPVHLNLQNTCFWSNSDVAWEDPNIFIIYLEFIKENISVFLSWNLLAKIAAWSNSE